MSPRIARPNKNIEDLVQDIFKQAHSHRDSLIKFYMWYTCILSGLVMLLIFGQACARFLLGAPSIELIPQWALNLIVIGMFGQFIGLLAIVTKKVWEFEPFFKHADGQTKKGEYDKN